jgi:dipeptidyl aminopeptidase/acylaminoacyl peptidase
MKAYRPILALCALAAPLSAYQTIGTAAAAQAPGTRAADDPVPVEAFAALPSLDRPKLSPDGTRIAAKIPLNGKQYLVVLPLFGGPGAKPAMLELGDDIDLNWWRWVGNDWLAVGLGAQVFVSGQEIYVTRLAGLSADMKTMNHIDWTHAGQVADDVIWAARDGSPHVLLSKQTDFFYQDMVYPSVFDVDLSTAKVHKVSPSVTNVFDWFADGAGALRMGYRYDDQTLRSDLLYRSGASSSFATIATHRHDDAHDMIVPDVFRADGTAVATSDGEERNYQAVYEVSLPDLKLGKKIYGLDGYDIEGVIENVRGDDVDGVNLTDTYPHTVWLNPTLKTLQDDLDKTVGDRRPRIISWSADRTKLLIELGRPSEAGQLYYWDTSQGSMKFYAFNSPLLRDRVLSPVRTIRYPARDGLSIEAVLTLPRTRPARDLPLIVFPHGGPFARDSEGWDWWAQFLAENGYAVIQPNYRGSSGYGTVFAKKGEGEWGLKMQDDLVDAVIYLAKQGIADPKRVCIAGGSYGGYAAMRAAERDGAVYRCAVSYAGVSDLAALKRYDSQFLTGNGVADWLKKQAPNFAVVSPHDNAAHFSIPILLVHGRADRRVPVNQSRMMASALKAAGKPYQYIEQPLADHFFSRSEDRLQFLKAMKAFLDEYNPA